MLTLESRTLLRVFRFIGCLVFLIMAPSYSAYASANASADISDTVTVQSGKETDFFEGALKLEGTVLDISDDLPGNTDTSDTSLKSGKLRSVRNGAAHYSLTELGGNEYGYNLLSDSEKRLFDAIGEQVEAFIAGSSYKDDLNSESARITVNLDASQNEFSENDLANTICRFVYCNPQYYWIGLSYSYGLRTDSVAAVINVDPYYYSYSSRKAADDAIKAKTDAWVDEICSAASNGDFYAVLKAHDIIIRAIDYAYDSSGKPEQSMWAHSIAGVFTGQGAVCEGYAKCFEYLLDKAGIQNIYILGTGAKEAHAWNAVELLNQWYLCDVTWDDPDSPISDGLNDSNYSYFCIPESKFNQKHHAWDDSNYFGYELPEFEDTMEQSYFTVFDCYSEESFTSSSGESFAASILDSRYRDNDYVFAAFPTNAKESFAKYVVPHLTDLDPSEGYTLTDTVIATIAKYASPIIDNPAGSITIEAGNVEIDIAESVSIKAILPKGSDDKVIWSAVPEDENDSSDADRYINISAKGTEAIVTGRRNGTVILTAVVYSSTKSGTPISASCTIKVGSGADIAEDTIWQNGTKEKKSLTITPKLSATTWTDSKGNVKSGKLVWYVTDKSTDPIFNSGKHTVSFMAAKSKLASVNNKGVVTAKKAGTVYVYVCDTGSLTYEEHIIDIAAGPTKLFLTRIANSTNKDVILKKVGIDAGSTGKVYITPFIKDGAVDADCTYTVRVAKPEMEKYLSVDKVTADVSGYPYFTFKALDFNREKSKTVSVKIEVICDQTGKKTSMTVVIANPVLDASCIDPDAEKTQNDDDEPLKLSRKGNTITLKLYLTTTLEGTNITTDKIKIYVGLTDVSFNDNDRVEAERGATVKAKFDRDAMKITLTASKNAGKPALITAAFTDVLTKEITLIDLAEVDEDGIVKIW